VLREYVNRDELIKELSSMDFLVAIDLDMSSKGLNAVPSKIIDYALAKRPILKYEHSKLPVDKIDDFMNFNFIDSFKVNIELYDTVKVTDQFLKLIEESK
jgi:hypothetical protein